MSDFAPAPDRALSQVFERVQRGDQQAFASLYDELSPKIFGTVKRVLRDPAMSEEVTQEVFVEIWQQADRFDPERASVATWALTMARRRAVDRVRREQSQRNRVEALAGQRDDAVNEPGQQVIDGLEAGAVRDALGQLPADQRDVLILSFLEGLPHGEIAERLDIPLGTVKGRVRGGLKKLRAGLEARDE
ncbi:MAG: sigma-70 family RNA polymerase sigma factor [Ilumatobacter sp.]|uniref:sigma-70 family RNA polymerase sigma factor n=1 Tax=Ilumatobacter sp. TaxID=1967498 RepID=UPI003C759810